MHGASGIFKNNAVIRGFQVTIADAYVLTVIGINAVAVGKLQIVQDADAIDQDVVAADKVRSPKGTALERDLPYGEMCDMLQKEQGNSGIKASVNMPMGNVSVEDFLISVDAATASYGNIFTVLGV